MTAVGALQRCLAAEHATVFGYGVVGGVLSVNDAGSAAAKLARASYVVHRSRRDQWTRLLRSLGATPVAAQPSYALPFRVHSTSTAERLGRQLERRCGGVYAYAVSQLAGDQRDLAADALTDSAVRTVEWGATPVALPGLD